MRGFSRGGPGTITAAHRKTIKRGIATTWSEAAVIDKLRSEYEGGLRWSHDPRAAEKAAELLSVAFGRTVTQAETVECGTETVEAAASIWTYQCHADDMPRTCGAVDTRFSFFWTADEVTPCPLEGLCLTQQRNNISQVAR